ncbi:MAG TPA: helix-turn-helix domain-containing protein [Myxococcota bacterium]|nr:helix-turn-helix domain-containing protein [Myxococcota bacterium]
MTHLDLHLPDEAATHQADDALHALASVEPGARADLHAAGLGKPVRLPAEAVALLREVLAAFAKGEAVAVVPVAAEVTAQQAAEILRVSRPFVIRLIDEGKLPVRMVGTHRRIPLADLLAYKEAHKARARDAAVALTQETQDLGLGY